MSRHFWHLSLLFTPPHVRRTYWQWRWRMTYILKQINKTAVSICSCLSPIVTIVIVVIIYVSQSLTFPPLYIRPPLTQPPFKLLCSALQTLNKMPLLLQTQKVSDGKLCDADVCFSPNWSESIAEHSETVPSQVWFGCNQCLSAAKHLHLSHTLHTHSSFHGCTPASICAGASYISTAKLLTTSC